MAKRRNTQGKRAETREREALGVPDGGALGGEAHDAHYAALGEESFEDFFDLLRVALRN
jgi:hypothetical protein